MHDFQQILASRALIDDLVKRIFSRATADTSERGMVLRRRVGAFQWVGHRRILKNAILIQHLQKFGNIDLTTPGLEDEGAPRVLIRDRI
jgi:hypothetical protein